MTDATLPSRPPKLVIFAALLVVAALGAWMMTRAYQPPVVRACRAAYAAARTAADTTAIDTTIVPEGRRLAEPRTCGSFRWSARWQ